MPTQGNAGQKNDFEVNEKQSSEHYGRFVLDFFQIEDTLFQKDIKIAMKSYKVSYPKRVCN